jgi:hypothetical protein
VADTLISPKTPEVETPHVGHPPLRHWTSKVRVRRRGDVYLGLRKLASAICIHAKGERRLWPESVAATFTKDVRSLGRSCHCGGRAVRPLVAHMRPPRRFPDRSAPWGEAAAGRKGWRGRSCPRAGHPAQGFRVGRPPQAAAPPRAAGLRRDRHFDCIRPATRMPRRPGRYGLTFTHPLRSPPSTRCDAAASRPCGVRYGGGTGRVSHVPASLSLTDAVDSTRRESDAPAARKNAVHQPRNAFSVASTRRRHSPAINQIVQRHEASRPSRLLPCRESRPP